MTNEKIMMGLKNKVTVYVPTTVDVNVKADTTDILKHTVKEMASIAGGATVNEASGYWVSECGELVEEKVFQVHVYHEKNLADNVINKAVELAEYIKKELKQEAVSVEIDGSLNFI